MESRHAAAAVLLSAALLSGCAAGAEQEAGTAVQASPPALAVTPEPSSAASPTAAPSAAAPSAAPSSAAPTSAAPAPVRTVSVRYAGGAVTGTSGREQVRLGEPVVLRIASDVAEQVHVHGYDLEADIPAGGSTDVSLTATIPGVFEVELHESGKALFQLRVS